MNIGIDGSRAFFKNRTGTENYSYQLIKNISLVDHTNNYYIYLRPDSVLTSLATQVFDSEDFGGELSRTVAQTRGGSTLQGYLISCRESKNSELDLVLASLSRNISVLSLPFKRPNILLITTIFL